MLLCALIERAGLLLTKCLPTENKHPNSNAVVTETPHTKYAGREVPLNRLYIRKMDEFRSTPYYVDVAPNT